MKSELIKYQIEYYDMINDNTDYMTVFAYDTAGLLEFLIVYIMKNIYLLQLNMYTESED